MPTPNVELSHLWHPWVGSTLQHPFYQEENPGSGLTVATIRPHQFEILFGSTNDFNQKIRGHTPTLSFLDGPLVEKMLQEARAGLTKAMVIGPGRVVLFYGRHLMGECLKVDEARDAAFLLTGAGTWVGKATYLTANPMTIQEGKRAIAQAIFDNRVKVRGPGCPCANPLAQQPFWFNAHRASPLKDESRDCSSGYCQTPHWSSRG